MALDLPYIALTAFVTIIARSSAAGMAIGLGYYFFEQLIVALFSALFSWFQNVATSSSYGISQLGREVQEAASRGRALPDATQAIIVLAVYTLVFGGIAFWLFERRDVAGATGGG